MRAVQYHPDYCAEAKADMEANGWRPFDRWDNSHDLSVITDCGLRVYVGQYQSADKAYDAGLEIERTGVIPDAAKGGDV